MVLVGGIAAICAGACWIVKASAILATGVQPPVLFESAPLLMAIAALGLASQVTGSSRRVASMLVAMVALVAATPVLLDEVAPLPAFVTGAGMATAHMLILVALAVVGLDLRRRLHRVLPLLIAVMTVPAVVAGGLLMALVGERALEMPILLLGGAWTALGMSMLQDARPRGQR